MYINHDMYDVLDTLLSDNDGLGVPLERTLSLATTTSNTTSSSIIYDIDDNIDFNFGNYDDLPYENNTSSSMDIAPLIVNFEDDLVIDI